MAANQADRIVEKRLEAGAWGALFLWMGIVLLAHLGWATGLIGFGVVILGAQLARTPFGLRPEGFWIIIGALFVLGGVWQLFQVQVGLVPILCIIAGVALLVSALYRRRESPTHG